MLRLEWAYPTAEHNVALDEALLEQAEVARSPWEVLRIWEPAQVAVIVGRSSRVSDEVNEPECRKRRIPILRRSSGGTAIIAAPGCLMYALVLSYQLRPPLRAIAEAHRFVLGRLVEAIGPLVPDVRHQGTSDLTLGGRKFSGNSLRCRRRYLLYHGTLLYDCPLELMGACLTMPPRQPDYRAGRAHEAFVTNLPVDPGTLRRALISAWDAQLPCTDWPADLVEQLVGDKYSRREWNYKYY